MSDKNSETEKGLSTEELDEVSGGAVDAFDKPTESLNIGSATGGAGAGK